MVTIFSFTNRLFGWWTVFLEIRNVLSEIHLVCISIDIGLFLFREGNIENFSNTDTEILINYDNFTESKFTAVHEKINWLTSEFIEFDDTSITER